MYDAGSYGQTGGAYIFNGKEKTSSWHLLLPQITTRSHRRIHGPQTYVQIPWLIVSVNIGYSFNVNAWMPLRVAMIKHCETRMLLPNAGKRIIDWL